MHIFIRGSQAGFEESVTHYSGFGNTKQILSKFH